jgi:PAS domain S-box-containing protein
MLKKLEDDVEEEINRYTKPEKGTSNNNGFFLSTSAEKEAEKLFSHNKSWFRIVFEESPIGIEVFDKEGTLIGVNRACLDIFGITADEIRGFNFFDDAKITQEAKERLRRGEIGRFLISYDLEKPEITTHFTPQKKGIIHLDIINTPLKSDGSSEVKGYLVQLVDNTAHRLIGDALTNSETRYRRLFETAQDGILILDADTEQIIDVNPFLLDILGYPKEGFLGKKLWEIGAFKDEEASRAAFSELQQKGYIRYEDLPLRTKDGQLIDVEFVSNSYLVDHKRVIQCNIRDVTARKRAEEELKHAHQQLLDIIDFLPDATFVIDKDHRVIAWNKRMEMITGILKAEMLGKGEYVYAVPFYRVPRPMMADLVIQRDTEIERTYETTHFEDDIFTAETYAPLAYGGKGGYFWGIASPLRDCNGQIIGAIQTIRDIGERKQIEEKLQEYARNLKRSNEDLERFAYVASHDLQEPLRNVVSFSQLLSRRYKGKMAPDADEFIEYIIEGGKRMQALINDLLEYSRLNTRAEPFESINCEELIDRVRQNLFFTIQENNAVIETTPLPSVNADPGQLALVFQNLITNAIKFRGEEPPYIHISAENIGDMWKFAVRDNGIGIDPAFNERIFEIFQRLHTREKYPGTGVGLAIVKKIIERHGGQIWVESEMGGGSTFYFTLPSSTNS